MVLKFECILYSLSYLIMFTCVGFDGELYGFKSRGPYRELPPALPHRSSGKL